jgi:hypothetical protein
MTASRVMVSSLADATHGDEKVLRVLWVCNSKSRKEGKERGFKRFAVDFICNGTDDNLRELD